MERRIFAALGEDGPEHEPKEARILVSELDIGKARSSEKIGSARRVLHRRGEFAETFGGDGSQEIVLTGEMPVSGRRRDANAPRRLAQPNGLRAVLIKDLAGGVEQSRRQIAVAIGTCGPHSNAYRGCFTLSTPGPL